MCFIYMFIPSIVANERGGLGVSTARHSLVPFPYGLAIVVHQQTEQEKKERKDREKEFSCALFSLSEMMTSGRDDSSEPPACHCFGIERPDIPPARS